MKKIHLLFSIAFLFSNLLSAAIHQGYLVTLNGKMLTGQIGAIYQGDNNSEVIFINDFGTIYNIRPELIRGFVFKKGPEFIVYESKFNEKRWMFLKVLFKGENLHLYQSPQEIIQLVQNYRGFVNDYSYRPAEYFLEMEGKIPFKVKRIGFKKQMHRLLRKNAPDLADKIGDKGFHYKDLPKIVREYNLECKKTRWKS